MSSVICSLFIIAVSLSFVVPRRSLSEGHLRPTRREERSPLTLSFPTADAEKCLNCAYNQKTQCLNDEQHMRNKMDASHREYVDDIGSHVGKAV